MPPPSAPDAGARADQAVLHALPLVIMDLPREPFFADPMAADATPYRFLHIPILANPSFRSVVRPSVDTLSRGPTRSLSPGTRAPGDAARATRSSGPTGAHDRRHGDRGGSPGRHRMLQEW